MYLVLVLAVILISTVLHELMHAVTAYWLGDPTAKEHGRISLNPLKHIDPVLSIALPMILAITSMVTGAALPIFGGAKPVPFRPDRVKWGEFGAALVGVIGPLTNLVLAFIFYAIFAMTQPTGGILLQFLALGVQINLGFFIFNMIPIPPLDGSRVLYALAPDSIRRGMEAMERFGLVVVFAVVLLFNQPLGQFMSAAINFFISIFAKIFGV